MNVLGLRHEFIVRKSKSPAEVAALLQQMARWRLYGCKSPEELAALLLETAVEQAFEECGDNDGPELVDEPDELPAAS